MPFYLRTAVLAATLLPIFTPAFADPVKDARLEGALQTALSLNRMLNPFRIKVEVDGKQARLAGEVENEVERQLAEDVARATRGIEQVENQLQVNAQLVERPLELRAYAQRLEDATLAAVIRARLLWSRTTEKAPIEVQSSDGVVTLRGRVDSAEAKELAGVVARTTDGVHLVNNLVSLDTAAMAKAREMPVGAPTGPQPSDSWIIDKIQNSYRFSRNLDGLNLKVASEAGMVRLSGEVVSAEQKTIAVEIARQIIGVRGVDADLLKVATKVEG
ncbi:TPA: BON domain-containing protein [Pseudomonas putida]|uniref:BON domain-containing protein n=1 Tax=Pseudomonas putida TaxID=303 RepID=A0AAW6PU72_PSEPU|nr:MULTISPECIES: BON domain-containing protein [Pseudomonas]MDN5673773.1 BON domain-containing protein [Pseudomonas sp.]ELU0818714.1 BON domain-containing protein [Pseudomonas putida]KWW18472.1 transporter [Pseudomonas putida]MBH3350629.1 BON domain-containing protein [Pseudomonas putida]MBH3391497.1 BON domain-containing protein [Pseudomonas putida]